MSTALWTDSRFYGPELLQISDSVAREKGLEKEKKLRSKKQRAQNTEMNMIFESLLIAEPVKSLS